MRTCREGRAAPVRLLAATRLMKMTGTGPYLDPCADPLDAIEKVGEYPEDIPRRRRGALASNGSTCAY